MEIEWHSIQEIGWHNMREIRHLASLGVLAGGSGWNGGAEGPLLPSAQQVAWFITTETEQRQVRFCISENSGSSARIVELQAAMKRSYKRWIDYIQDKDIPLGSRSKFIFAKQTQSLEGLSHCDGSEDLKIALGTRSKDIEIEKRKYFQPIGFSKRGMRESHSMTPWFRQSLIWISDTIFKLGLSERVSNRLFEIILTHELGHAFGNDHVQGTIMDVRVGEIITKDLPKNQEFQKLSESDQLKFLESLLAIDQQKTLFLSRSTNTFPITFFPGKLSTTETESKQRFNPDQQKSLKKTILPQLLGIPLRLGDYTPALNGTVSLKQSPSGNYSLHSSFPGQKTHQLDLGKPLKSLAIAEASPQQRVFRIDGQTSSFSSESKVLAFRLQLPNTLELPVYIYLNAPGSLQRGGRFTLEVGDPGDEDSSWILLLDRVPRFPIDIP